MAKVRSKGTALLQSIASVYTAIAQVKSIDITGEKSETYDSTTLDGGAYKTKDPTGYVEPCVIKADIFYDPALAGHQAYTSLVATPVATNFKVTYVDGSTTSAIYSGTGFGIDKKVAMNDGLTATIEITTSGAPS